MYRSGCFAKSAMMRWITPRTGVITIGFSADAECANSFRVWIRRATVSLRGLKRSCGNVSQAGNSRTRSCKSRSSLAMSSAPRLEPLMTRTGLDWAICAIKNGKLGGGVTKLWDRCRLFSLVASINSGKSASEFNKPRMTTSFEMPLSPNSQRWEGANYANSILPGRPAVIAIVKDLRWLSPCQAIFRPMTQSCVMTFAS